MYDYSNLLGAMRQRGITQKSLAKSVGKSEATINRKLCGAREFTQSEMFKILEIIGEPVERVSFYFFYSSTCENASDIIKPKGGESDNV